MNVEKRIEQLLKDIAEMYRELTELEHENIYLYNDFTKIKTGIVKEVLEEVNEQGKPKYSNDKAREAEISRRLSEDPKFQEVYINYKMNSLQIADTKRKIDVAKNELKYLIIKLAIVKGYASELREELKEIRKEISTQQPLDN